jgi:two-component system NarL family response regulator
MVMQRIVEAHMATSSIMKERWVTGAKPEPGLPGPAPARTAPSRKEHTGPIRVLIVDDHELVREGLAEMLSRAEGFEIVGTADGGARAVELFEQTRPDISIVDLRMAPMDGVQTIAALRRIDPDANAIILTTYDTDEEIYQSLKAGAASYLSKSVGFGDLVETLRAVHAGERRIPEAIAAKLAEHMATPTLTPRQLDTLRLVVEGHSNREIAGKLNVTEGTVKAHVKAILAKLGARDRAQAASIALRRGLVRAR